MTNTELNPTTWDEAAERTLAPILRHWRPGVEVDTPAEVPLEWLRVPLENLRGGLTHPQRSVDSPVLLELLAHEALDMAYLMGMLDTDTVTDYGDRVVDTLVSKQHDYGHSNITAFGLEGIVVRLSDKIARLGNLVKRSTEPLNESAADTVMDIIGYCVIGIMLREGTFMLELKADHPLPKLGAYDPQEVDGWNSLDTWPSRLRALANWCDLHDDHHGVNEGDRHVQFQLRQLANEIGGGTLDIVAHFDPPFDTWANVGRQA